MITRNLGGMNQARQIMPMAKQQNKIAFGMMEVHGGGSKDEDNQKAQKWSNIRQNTAFALAISGLILSGYSILQNTTKATIEATTQDIAKLVDRIKPEQFKGFDLKDTDGDGVKETIIKADKTITYNSITRKAEETDSDGKTRTIDLKKLAEKE